MANSKVDVEELEERYKVLIGLFPNYFEKYFPGKDALDVAFMRFNKPNKLTNMTYSEKKSLRELVK